MAARGVAEVVHERSGETADGGDTLLADELFARAANAGGHSVECAGQAAQFVVAGDFYIGAVIALGYARGGAVQFFHRAQNAAGQDPGEQDRGQHGARPDQHDIAAKGGQVPAGGVETALDAELSYGLARDIKQGSGQFGYLARRRARGAGCQHAPAGRKDEVAAAGGPLQRPRKLRIHDVARHQHIQQRRAGGGLHVNRSDGNLVEPPSLHHEAGRLFGKAGGGGAYGGQVAHLRTLGGDYGAVRVRHQEQPPFVG